jgi:hypothetical protein
VCLNLSNHEFTYRLGVKSTRSGLANFVKGVATVRAQRERVNSICFVQCMKT